MFSIISPVYNTEKYLDKFIKSVINQTYIDFELILVDDGSTDKSFDICKYYANIDRRVKIFQQNNTGAGGARNFGISKATGKYILFWDSDDWVASNALEILNNELSQKDVDMLIYNFCEVKYDKNEQEINRKSNLLNNYNCNNKVEARNFFCELIFTSVMNSPCNKVYNANLINKYNIIFADTRRAQDAFFNMEYFKYVNSINTINIDLYYYRTNTQNKVWKKFPKNLYETDILYDKYLVAIFNEFEIYSGIQREKIDTLFYNSILRTIGFYKNPFWKMSLKEKYIYVYNIISNEYNQKRASEALAVNKKTKKIQKYIINKNVFGIIFLYNYIDIYNTIYNYYVNNLKRKHK